MLHRQRVSGWAPVFGTAFEMLLAAQAAVLYYGVLNNDPHTVTLAALAATGSGSVSWLVLFGLWIGITLNVPSCPGVVQTPIHYPNLNQLNSDTRAIMVASDRTEWTLHYSTAQWRGLAKLLGAGYTNLPYRACYEYAHLSRDTWQKLKLDLCRAGLANRKGREIFVNDEGRRAIYQYARTPLPQEANS